MATFHLTTWSVKIKVFTIDNLLSCHCLTRCVEIIPAATCHFDKTVGNLLTCVGIKVAFLTLDSEQFTFDLSTIAAKVVNFIVNVLKTCYFVTILVKVSPLVSRDLNELVDDCLASNGIIIASFSPATF